MIQRIGICFHERERGGIWIITHVTKLRGKKNQQEVVFYHIFFWLVFLHYAKKKMSINQTILDEFYKNKKKLLMKLNPQNMGRQSKAA